jgi:hypothetical protein
MLLQAYDCDVSLRMEGYDSFSECHLVNIHFQTGRRAVSGTLPATGASKATFRNRPRSLGRLDICARFLPRQRAGPNPNDKLQRRSPSIYNIPFTVARITTYGPLSVSPRVRSSLQRSVPAFSPLLLATQQSGALSIASAALEAVIPRRCHVDQVLGLKYQQFVNCWEWPSPRQSR